MASAHSDGRGGFIATFRRYMGAGRQRAHARVPRERLRPGHEQDDADAFANECDQALRLLEVSRSVAGVNRARALGAITEQLAGELLAALGHGGRTMGAVVADAGGPLTILDAARMHPSSARETEQDPKTAERHERELGLFTTWAKVTYLHQVELGVVMQYVSHMAKAEVSWDGRRHRLLWLRRACRMGATKGIPDVLGELKLDVRPVRTGPEPYWSLDELARGWSRTTDARLRVAIGLGGFLGLRPTELHRAAIAHLSDGMLLTGYKNKQSVRLLPLPSFLREAIAEAVGTRASGAIIQSHKYPRRSAKNKGHFDDHSLEAWFTPAMKAASGKGEEISPKHLRKSFTNWAYRTLDFPPQHVEAFMGHRTALASAVTGRHYLAELAARELRPSVAIIERVFSAALERAAADTKPIPITTAKEKANG